MQFAVFNAKIAFGQQQSASVESSFLLALLYTQIFWTSLSDFYFYYFIIIIYKRILKSKTIFNLKWKIIRIF